MSLARDIANYIRGIFVNNSTGYVGISNNAPAHALDIGAALSNIRLAPSTTTNNALLRMTNGGGNAFVGLDANGGGLGGQYSLNVWHSGAYPIVFGTSDVARARITSGGDLQFNSGYGSVATAYGCRAWVNFNGTGTVAIRASGNVSSITDNGTGDYTVNFTTAMPDANYSPSFMCQFATAGGAQAAAAIAPLANAQTTTSMRLYSFRTDTAASTDFTVVGVSIFR